jgi:hypothetical protein
MKLQSCKRNTITLMGISTGLFMTMGYAADATQVLDPLQINSMQSGRSSSAQQRPELAPTSATNPFRVTESSTGFTQIIDREQIENIRPRDVYDLLDRASASIATDGSKKGFSGLMIRGDSNFRFIVDGAYLQPTMASRMMKNIPVMAIEEVQIVRGASALTMGPMTGSASPGGAPVDGFVIIRTRKPTQESENQARLALESNSTTQAGVWAGKQISQDNKSYVAGLINKSNIGSPSDKLDNGNGYNRDSEATSGLVKSGFNASGWMVDMMYYRDSGSYDIPNTNSHGSGSLGWTINPTETNLFALTGSKSWDKVNTTLFSLSRAISHQVLNTTGPAVNDNETTHVNVRHNIDWNKTRFVLGGDYFHWNAPSGQQYYEGIQREEETKGYFGQIEHKMLNDRLIADASYRKDQVYVLHGLDYYTAGQQPIGGTSTNLKTRNKMLEPATFSSLGLSYLATDNLKLNARFGQSSQESNGLLAAPSTTLGDDKQSKWEVGFDLTMTPWFNPQVNYFHREVQNEKSLYGYQDGSSVYTYKKVAGSPGYYSGATALTNMVAATATPIYSQADTTRGGFEFATTGRLSNTTHYRLGYTKFTELSASAEPITPEGIFDLSMSHRMGKYLLTGAWKNVSKYQGSASDTTAYLGGYNRYDLGLGYDWKFDTTPVRTTLYGRNLSDEHYETNNGVQDVGRVIGVEFLANF